ncbi:MAG: transglutaminase family protein [Inhella sp.]|jgi:transglutaminase-like putative cysteine protease|uniref:transglutaminase family protein n=3 Tax=Inhella sp. TaxID=1921806 RepID=UPI0022C70035|nr:transglutaminase family protein [Inhella sp.]MCZ8236001.1 transglutaminase family protein [Inhella sp.]
MAVRRLLVQHDTVYEHQAPVELAHHVAFLVPRHTAHQRVVSWQLSIDPLPDGWAEASWEAQRQISLDAWGNARLVFGHSRVHQELAVRSRFTVERLPQPPLDPELSPPWERVVEQLRYSGGNAQSPETEFSLASPFAAPDAALTQYGRRAFAPGLPLAAGALALMGQVHTDFAYTPNSTRVDTRAVEAFRLRRGVCQDFAQVFIAACRGIGLAARYVSGYLLTQPPPGQPKLIGADASHAWVEIWCPRQGWLALDPTNNLVVGQDHALLAWGRDQADVAPLRGVIRGGGQAWPQVSVTVTALP